MSSNEGLGRHFKRRHSLLSGKVREIITMPNIYINLEKHIDGSIFASIEGTTCDINSVQMTTMVMVMDGGVAIIMTFHHKHKNQQYIIRY